MVVYSVEYYVEGEWHVLDTNLEYAEAKRRANSLAIMHDKTRVRDFYGRIVYEKKA